MKKEVYEELTKIGERRLAKIGVNFSDLLQIEPGETCQVKLPFSMIDFHFFPDDWDHVEDRQYELVLSLYPIKRVIRL